VRAALVLLVVLGACATEAQEPPPPSVSLADPEMTTVAGDDDAAGPDLCALAAALPDDDICSLVCDPGALAARMLADGNEPGSCYQLYCALSESVHVLAGVCLVGE